MAKRAAEAANVMAKEQEAAAAAEAEKHRREALADAGAAAAARATAAEKAAATSLKEKERKAKEAHYAKAAWGSTGGNPTSAQHSQKTSLPEDSDDWELSEGDLPEGSTLSGSKAFLEGYPEDEANSKRNKSNNLGQGEKERPNTNDEDHLDARRPMRGQLRPTRQHLLPLLPKHAPRG